MKIIAALFLIVFFIYHAIDIFIYFPKYFPGFFTWEYGGTKGVFTTTYRGRQWVRSEIKGSFPSKFEIYKVRKT